MKLFGNCLSFACEACGQVVEITNVRGPLVRCRCIWRRCERYGVELVFERPVIAASVVPVVDGDGVESEGGEVD